MGALLVITNLPNRESAMQIAERLVEERLAACVNVLGECTSVYRWQGAVQREPEVPLFIKTLPEAYGRVEAAIRALHPYELPEIVAVPISAGLAGYLEWVAAEVVAPQG